MGVYDLPTAKQRVTDYATGRYGRGPTSDQEWAAIAQGINYDDGVTDEELTQAYGNADRYAASLGATPTIPSPPPAPVPPPAPPPPGPAPTPEPPPQQTPSYTVPTPPNLQATVPGLFNQQPASPIQQAYQGALIPLIQQSQQPVAPTVQGTAYQPASEVFRATRQRQTDRARNALAERMAAQGTLGSGGFDAGIQQLYNQEGLDIAGNDARLIEREIGSRRQQLMQGLALAQASGNAEAVRQLQTQLGLLSAATGESQFGRELGFRERALGQQGSLGRGELALRLMSLLTGNQYNYDVLGSNNARWLSDYNQRLIESLL